MQNARVMLHADGYQEVCAHGLDEDAQPENPGMFLRDDKVARNVKLTFHVCSFSRERSYMNACMFLGTLLGT